MKSPTNGPLLAAAAQLWITDTDLVLDMTYGRGGFWTVYRPAQLIAHDLELDQVDFRNLPEASESVDVVVFDPPHMPYGGRLSPDTAGFRNRYGLHTGPRTLRELQELQAAGISEAVRVLRPKGRLLVKCCDYVDGGQFVTARHRLVAHALELGLAQVDELVHYSGTGPGAWANQQHSRRAHSYLCIFRKGRWS